MAHSYSRTAEQVIVSAMLTRGALANLKQGRQKVPNKDLGKKEGRWMKDEMQKTDAIQGSEMQDEELQQAAGGTVAIYGEAVVFCPRCRKYEPVIKSKNPQFKYYCVECNQYFNRR